MGYVQLRSGSTTGRRASAPADALGMMSGWRPRQDSLDNALATYRIPIEGRDEWLAAARRLA